MFKTTLNKPLLTAIFSLSTLFVSSTSFAAEQRSSKSTVSSAQVKSTDNPLVACYVPQRFTYHFIIIDPGCSDDGICQRPPGGAIGNVSSSVIKTTADACLSSGGQVSDLLD